MSLYTSPIIAKKGDAKKFISKKTGLSQKKAGEAFDATVAWIQTSLIQRKSVQLSGVGTLRTRINKGGQAYNLSTRQQIEYGPRRAISFRTSSVLKLKLPPLNAKELELLNRK